MAIPLQQRGVRDVVGHDPAAWRRHLREDVLGRWNIGAFDADVDHGIIRDPVVRDPLRPHLAEQRERLPEVLLEPAALNESRVQYSVAVLLALLHIPEDLQGLLEAAALHARVDHAAARDGVRLRAFLRHAIPQVDHPRGVASLAVRLDQYAQGDVGGPHAQLLHAQHRLLEAREVPCPVAGIHQSVEQHLVRLPRVQLDELLGQVQGPVHQGRTDVVRRLVAHGQHQQPRDRKARRHLPSSLHVLQLVPGPGDVLLLDALLQRRRQLPGGRASRAARPGASAAARVQARGGGGRHPGERAGGRAAGA
mmetsp:Transcript_44469/g.127318  ORF Transcript_44469/g.127318 Transcript_44469/m.127318 type:complete len:308 (+) Transcript_44469:1852-2775(+)